MSFCPSRGSLFLSLWGLFFFPSFYKNSVHFPEIEKIIKEQEDRKQQKQFILSDKRTDDIKKELVTILNVGMC